MSDYAGPILGAVGAVVGFYIGGPTGAMYGWSIGMTVGGAYATSQQVIPGPKIGDVVRQTSQEGGFRPIVYGRSHPIAGNVIADSEPKIVTRRESQGKGGPKVESESAYRTYAVGFCEGEAKLLQAWRNGILVYDVEDPSMAAENAKFLEYATWYTGSFDQPASPDLEEIYGAGQAPFFRGTAYLSIHNEDVTDQRGAWSQWQVRVFRGAAKSHTSTPYPIVFDDAYRVESKSVSFQRWKVPDDELGILIDAVDLEARSIVLPPFSFDDDHELSVDAIELQTQSIVLPPYVGVDEVDLSVDAVELECLRILFTYGNYRDEHELSIDTVDLDVPHI